MDRTSCDVLIAGGGIAGLTAAAYLSANGHRALLAEKNGRCGGLVNSFTRDGFRFDAGIRAFEDAGIITPALSSLGLELEFVRSPVSVGVADEILNVDGAESLTAYRRMLGRLYPQSTGEIERIIAVIKRVMKHMDVLYGIENPIIKDPMSDRAYLFGRLLPWLFRFLLTIGRINRMDYPVEDLLARLTGNRALRDIISQHFFAATPAFFAMSYFSLYLDYMYPVGGTGRLPEALERRFVELGGEVATCTEIHEVCPARSIAYDAEGKEYQYGALLWAADLKTLYRVTDTRGLSLDVAAGIEERKTTVLERRGGDSVFVLFLSVDEPPESFARIAHGHFFYTPSRAGLGELHRGELRHMLDRWNQVSRDDLRTWTADFCRLNTYEISIPVLKDPAAAPPGKTGVVASVLFSYDLMKLIKERGWYEEFRHDLEERMVEVLSDSIYPMLKHKLTARFSATPLSIEESAGCSEGAITGWSFEEPSPAVNRMTKAAGAVTTPIPGVFQAGQWTYSPAGVPMSILTGKLAADRIGKSLRRRKPG